jgi:hypothetical protein
MLFGLISLSQIRKFLWCASRQSGIPPKKNFWECANRKTERFSSQDGEDETPRLKSLKLFTCDKWKKSLRAKSWAWICKRLKSPEIPWNRFRQAGNRFVGSLKRFTNSLPGNLLSKDFRFRNRWIVQYVEKIKIPLATKCKFQTNNIITQHYWKTTVCVQSSCPRPNPTSQSAVSKPGGIFLTYVVLWFPGTISRGSEKNSKIRHLSCKPHNKHEG